MDILSQHIYNVLKFHAMAIDFLALDIIQNIGIDKRTCVNNKVAGFKKLASFYCDILWVPWTCTNKIHHSFILLSFSAFCHHETEIIAFLRNVFSNSLILHEKPLCINKIVKTFFHKRFFCTRRMFCLQDYFRGHRRAVAYRERAVDSGIGARCLCS